MKWKLMMKINLEEKHEKLSESLADDADSL